MKSYATYLQGLYASLIVETWSRFPELQKHCNRDSSRLHALIESRGLPFAMVDLPSFGKHFDLCLAKGLLTPSNISGFGVDRHGGCIPRLFKGLILKVFDRNGVLVVDPDVEAIRLLRQYFYMAKKFKIASSNKSTWEHVDEFFKIDNTVRSPSLDWDGDELRSDRLRDLHFGDPCGVNPAPLLDRFDDLEQRECSSTLGASIADTLQRVCDAVTSEFGVFKPADWGYKHGPGAVADGNSRTFKYTFPYWPAKLENVFPMADFGFPNYASWAAFIGSKEYYKRFNAYEPPSCLFAVPKTLKGPRLIASEPISHQWCQQSMLDFFLDRIDKSSICSSVHIRDQRHNQNLARSASHTQSHATIDLSSASDRVSCWAVERLFRRSQSIVEALHSCRTRWVKNTIDRKSPQFHKLRKFACMGSACTFPVQSILFTCVAIAAVIHTDGGSVSYASVKSAAQEVQVYGDDIIVPMRSVDLVLGLLGDLGLKVNHTKTFYTGRFRESCGVDAFDGHDVTPSYAKAYPVVTRPESIESCVHSHNNFFRRGYERVATTIRRTVTSVRNYKFPEIPVDSGLLGWFSYDPDNSHLKSRWNTRIWLKEFRVDSFKTSQSLFIPEEDSVLLQYFTATKHRPDFLLGDRLGLGQRASRSLTRRWEGLPV